MIRGPFLRVMELIISRRVDDSYGSTLWHTTRISSQTPSRKSSRAWLRQRRHSHRWNIHNVARMGGRKVQIGGKEVIEAEAVEAVTTWVEVATEAYRARQMVPNRRTDSTSVVQVTTETILRMGMSSKRVCITTQGHEADLKRAVTCRRGKILQTTKGRVLRHQQLRSVESVKTSLPPSLLLKVKVLMARTVSMQSQKHHMRLLTFPTCALD